MGWISAGIGLVSAIMGKSSADKAAKQSMAGFRYLKGNEGVNQAQEYGAEAGTAARGLMGFGSAEEGEEAFDRYKESTGYQFRVDQGVDSITGSAAAKGLLNSGATAKGLTEYGQGMASSEFNKYLGQLRGMESTGLNAAYNVASQGTSGGAAAGAFTQQGTKDMMGGLGMAVGGLTDVAQQNNWFGMGA